MNRAKLLFTLTIFVLCLIALAGCGRRRNNDNDDDNNDEQERRYGVTLSVSGPVHMNNVMREAGQRLQEELAQQGIYLRLNLNLFSPDETEAAVIAQQTLLDAGRGDDVFVVTHYHNLLGLIDNDLLMDINALINRYASRDDFIARALDALEIGGRLYTFPLAVPVTYIGINANLPQSVINQFSERTVISVSEMVDIYNYLHANYPEWNHLSCSLNFTLLALNGIQELTDNHICLETRAAAFPQGADTPLTYYLDKIRQPVLNNARHGTIRQVDARENPISIYSMQLLSERYVFTSCFRSLDAIHALTDSESPFFINHVPLVNMDGGLSMHDISPYLVSVSAQANSTLAWAFLRHMLAAHPGSGLGEPSFKLPIKRGLLRQYTENAVLQALGETAAEGQIAYAINKHERLLSLPFSNPGTIHLLPFDVYGNVINAFLREELSAEVTNSLMQEVVTEWLEKGSVLELDLAALAEQMEREGLPVQVLSIFSSSDYYKVLREAERAINESWAQREHPYNFRLDITAYAPYDWDSWEMYQARLQTMMMAGQGYDIFIYGGQPIWSWAESGLLTDIWQLMDASSTTRRSDFYENILAAFELHGGLYAFPLSFGFEYVGINANLPDSVIDRFKQYDVITVVELMRIYTDMMRDYGDAFNYFRFSPRFALSQPATLMLSVLSSFVDFENRTVTLTDERFIEFLELLPLTLPGVGALDSAAGLMSNHTSRNLYGQLAEYNAFVMEGAGLTPAVAFLDVYDPFFVHFIPLANEAGRLRMNLWIGGIWAALVFPAAGNSTLAWEFTQYLIHAMTFPQRMGQYRISLGTMMQGDWGAASMATPIARDYFHSHLTSAVERLVRVEISFDEGRRTGFYGVFDEDKALFEMLDEIPYTASHLVESIVPRLTELNEMPAVIPPFIPDSLSDLLVSTLDLYLRGAISAAEAAQRMQNTMTLWLMEQG